MPVVVTVIMVVVLLLLLVVVVMMVVVMMMMMMMLTTTTKIKMKTTPMYRGNISYYTLTWILILVIHIACNRLTIQYKIQQIARVPINTSYFVMFLIHLQGSYFTIFRILLP